MSKPVLYDQNVSLLLLSKILRHLRTCGIVRGFLVSTKPICRRKEKIKKFWTWLPRFPVMTIHSPPLVSIKSMRVYTDGKNLVSDSFWISIQTSVSVYFGCHQTLGGPTGTCVCSCSRRVEDEKKGEPEVVGDDEEDSGGKVVKKYFSEPSPEQYERLFTDVHHSVKFLVVDLYICF